MKKGSQLWDNQAAIGIAELPQYYRKTKHIDINHSH